LGEVEGHASAALTVPSAHHCSWPRSAKSMGGITVHPLRKLEFGKAPGAQGRELLAEIVVFNSQILIRPIEGREVVATIFAQSSSTRGSGTYTAEFKIDERTTFLRWGGPWMATSLRAGRSS